MVDTANDERSIWRMSKLIGAKIPRWNGKRPQFYDSFFVNESTTVPLFPNEIVGIISEVYHTYLQILIHDNLFDVFELKRRQLKQIDIQLMWCLHTIGKLSLSQPSDLAKLNIHRVILKYKNTATSKLQTTLLNARMLALSPVCPHLVNHLILLMLHSGVDKIKTIMKTQHELDIIAKAVNKIQWSVCEIRNLLQSVQVDVDPHICPVSIDVCFYSSDGIPKHVLINHD